MNREQAINYLRSSGMSEEQIRTIEDAFKPGWIPVSERLPDEEGEYTACFDDGYITTLTYGMVIDRMDWELWADAGEVIAWMPLPEAHKESEVSDADSD